MGSSCLLLLLSTARQNPSVAALFHSMRSVPCCQVPDVRQALHCVMIVLPCVLLYYHYFFAVKARAGGSRGGPCCTLLGLPGWQLPSA
jgi:hypothetical protein